MSMMRNTTGKPITYLVRGEENLCLCFCFSLYPFLVYVIYLFRGEENLCLCLCFCFSLYPFLVFVMYLSEVRKIFVEYGEENAFEVKVKLLEVSLGKMMNFAIRIFGDGSFCGSEMF